MFDFSAKPLQNSQEFRFGNVNLFLLQHGAGNILGVGGEAQTHRSLVGLFRVLKKFHAPGGSPHKHRQHPGGHGVQCPAMADAPFMQDTPQLGNHVKRGKILGFIYN